jgi:hypothetical protein
MSSNANITVLHLDAGHDVNGNPKRLYVLVRPGHVVAVVSEGYRGVSALDDAFGPKAGVTLRKAIAVQLPVTGKAYTEIKRWAKDNGVYHSS